MSLVAIDEVNTSGGVLDGKTLELVRRDDESNPAKGVAAARELIEQEDVAVVFGGLDSPRIVSNASCLSRIRNSLYGSLGRSYRYYS